MTQFPSRRLAAATVLAALLTVFALPAAAAPVGAWNLSLEMPTFLSWLDAAWTGLFGVDVEEGDGVQSVYEKANSMREPDGLQLRAADTLWTGSDEETSKVGSW